MTPTYPRILLVLLLVVLVVFLGPRLGLLVFLVFVRGGDLVPQRFDSHRDAAFVVRRVTALLAARSCLLLPRILAALILRVETC